MWGIAPLVGYFYPTSEYVVHYILLHNGALTLPICRSL